MSFTNKVLFIKEIKGYQKSMCGISEICGPNPKLYISKNMH